MASKIKAKMSRRNKSSRSGPVASMQNKVVRIPFRLLYSLSANSANTNLAVSEINLAIANLGDRIIDAGDIYSYFRIASLRAYSYANTTVADTGVNTTARVIPDSGILHGLAFTPLNPTDYSSPSTLLHLVDFPEFSMSNGKYPARIRVGPSGTYQSSLTKWFVCGTQGSVEFTSAGALYLFIQNTLSEITLNSSCTAVVEGMAEFKEPIDTALIPDIAIKRRIKRDELKLATRHPGEEYHYFSEPGEDDQKSVSSVSSSSLTQRPVIVRPLEKVVKPRDVRKL